MREAGLIELRQAGKHHFYSICRPYLRQILEELNEYIETLDDIRPAKEHLGSWA